MALALGACHARPCILRCAKWYVWCGGVRVRRFIISQKVERNTMTRYEIDGECLRRYQHSTQTPLGIVRFWSPRGMLKTTCAAGTRATGMPHQFNQGTRRCLARDSVNRFKCPRKYNNNSGRKVELKRWPPSLSEGGSPPRWRICSVALSLGRSG